MALTPLPLVDDFLVPYHVGHALMLLFAVSIVGVIPLGSRKIVSANALLFGLLFLMTPGGMLGGASNAFPYRFLGVALLVIAPILFTTARE